MAAERTRRRLAAILAADVVGYSRLMSEDDAGTLAALNAHMSELIRPAVAGHDGRIFKTTGDGFLAEFASAVDAVACAKAVQDGMAARNASAGSARAIEFRIGVNVGDVIVEGDDVYGDGVNVAARLESLAEPGGILVSRTVHDHVRGRLGLGFVDLGDRAVKNIAGPVRAYRVFADPEEAEAFLDEREDSRRRARRRIVAGALALLIAGALVWSSPWRETAPPAGSGAVSVDEPEEPEEPPAPGEASLPLPDLPSVAVLPFAAAADDSPARLARGVSAELARALAGLSGLFVTDPASSLADWGGDAPPAEVARALGVGRLVDGAVRVAAGRISVTARLLDPATGNLVVARVRDGAPSDLPTVVAGLARDIAVAMGVEPDATESRALDQAPSRNLAAWDFYLQGRALTDEAAKGEGAARLDEARRLFRDAIARDPGYPGGYAGLSLTHSRAVELGLSDAPGDDLAKSADFASTAVAVDGSFVPGRLALAAARLAGGDVEGATQLYETALDLAPSSAPAHAGLALALAFAGRHGEAIDHAARAVRLDPGNPGASHRQILGLAHFADGDYRSAVEAWSDAAPGWPVPDLPAFLAAAYAELGDSERAAAARGRLLEGEPGFSVSGSPTLARFSPETRARIAAVMTEAGLPE